MKNNFHNQKLFSLCIEENHGVSEDSKEKTPWFKKTCIIVNSAENTAKNTVYSVKNTILEKDIGVEYDN
jgi:hypothetical protein